MEIIDVAVITMDKEYATALAWAIARNTQGLEVWVLEDYPSFNKGKMFDVLLTDVSEEEAARMAELRGNNGEAPLIVRLSDTRAEEKTCERTIYKYKNIKAMIRDVYYLISEKKGIQMISDVDHAVDVYCFAAERGGSGCSTISINFAGALVRDEGKKVIHISLDQFPDSYVSSGYGHERTLKQYIYHILFDEKGGKYTMTDTYLVEDQRGVGHFHVAFGPNPLMELDRDGYIRFLKSILKTGSCDAVVFDCGSQVSMQMIKTFEISRRIFIVTDGRRESAGWRNCVGRLMDEAARRRMVPVDVRDSQAVRKISGWVCFA